MSGSYVSVILPERSKKTVRNMCLNIHIMLLQIITNNTYTYVLVQIMLLLLFVLYIARTRPGLRSGPGIFKVLQSLVLITQF